MKKIKISKTKLFLFFVFFLFLFTRLYKISEIPVSVYWDEASIGYNAYSIGLTGEDEWGEFLPIHFRAFGEFKLPVYIYSVVPIVKLFELNAFSVRLPSVIFSLGVVVLVFLLGKSLSNSYKVGLWSSFFITISPWFFIFSRTGYEATAGLMFYLLGIYIFLFNRKNWKIFFSILSFILSAYSYNSFRIIIPLTIPILLLTDLKSIKNFRILPITLSVLIVCLSVIPIYRLYKYDSGSSRFQAVAADSRTFLTNYISHFSPSFLFISGDKNLRSQQLGYGQLFVYDAILIILGILYIKKSKSRYNWLPLIFILLAPIPAAMTKESPHSLRSIAIAPFISIVSAMGVMALINWTKKELIISLTVILVALTLFAIYFLNFLKFYPNLSAQDWQNDYKTIFTDIKLQSTADDKIFITDKYAQPYIFALFYLKYDPLKFREEVIRNSVDNWGFSTVKSFGKFEFVK